MACCFFLCLCLFGLSFSSTGGTHQMIAVMLPLSRHRFFFSFAFRFVWRRPATVYPFAKTFNQDMGLWRETKEAPRNMMARTPHTQTRNIHTHNHTRVRLMCVCVCQTATTAGQARPTSQSTDQPTDRLSIPTSSGHRVN